MRVHVLSATLLVLVSIGSTSLQALAAVDVSLEPAPRTVDRGMLFELQLIATSDSDNQQSISAMDIVFTWDPEVLKFVGVIESGPYAWLQSGLLNDAFNDDLDDGNAKFTALANFAEPALAPAEGFVVATLQFRALVVSNWSTVGLMGSTATSTATQVFGADNANQLITGKLHDARIATIMPRNCDGGRDFDIRDIQMVQTCFTGAVGPTTSAAYSLDPKLCCGVFDHDDDGDVDWSDHGFLIDLMTGPGQ